MENRIYNGAELATALKKGDLVNTGYMLAGIVRKSTIEGCIAFSISNGRQWIDIPTKLIESAEQVSIGSTQITNPMVRITFSEPKNSETAALLALLISAIDNVSRHLGANDNLAVDSSPNSFMARNLNNTGTGKSPTGAWCCKRGKSYPCGCYPDGGILICCDEWEPCTTIGPANTFMY